MKQSENNISEQRAKNCNKIGSYSLVTVIKNPIINPGETISIDQYISGYGLGSGIKVVYYPSSEVFNAKQSKVSFWPKYNQEKPITWGGITGQPDEYGGTVIAGPMYRTDSGELVTFCDSEANSNKNSIITEKNLGGNPPLHYSFKTNKNAKPGTYKISFVFTYFNGENWQSSTEVVEFKIQNNFERFSTALSILAATALLITIFADGLIPFLSWLFSFIEEDHLNVACTQMSVPLLRCT